MSERLHRRGGYREKAGRPTNKARGLQTRQSITVTLQPATVAALDAWAKSERLARSAAVEALLSEALGPLDAIRETQELLDELDGLLPGLQEAPEVHG